jgi:RND family efflux transporter MFP subunit
LKQLREGARQEVKDASQARLRESEAILAQERTRLQWTQITAPFAGEISKRYVDNGALLSTTTPVVTLAQTDTLKVMASVLERDVPLLKVGMKAKIQAEAYPDKVFEGKVSRLNSALELATRTLLAEITVPNPGRVLKPGMFTKIEVTLVEKPRTLVVPREAVIESEKDRVVFVVEENQAVRKRVTLGYEQGDFIEVTEGLKEGDRVIIRGQLSVKDRSPVKIVEGG